MGAEPDIVIDARGEFCPVPVIRTADAVKLLPPDGVVRVVSDDPAIEFDLPAWGRSAGCSCELAQRDGNARTYHVRKLSEPHRRRQP